MKHRASEYVKEESGTKITIKTEVEEAAPSAAYVEIEIDVNHLKQEPGLVQSVKSNPVLLVKEEILEDNTVGTDEQQGVPSTSTCAIVSRTSVAASSFEQGQLLDIKEELEDTDLPIGPVELQHMDSHGTDQVNLYGIQQENTILNLDSEEVLPGIDDGQVVLSQVRDETIESSWKDNAALAQRNSVTSMNGVVQAQSYRCDKCLKVYKSEIYLRRHSKQAHGTELHKCNQCDKEFKCKAYLLNHVRHAHSEEQYECDICKKMYKSRAAVRNHVSSFHRNRFADLEDSIYSCDKCKKSFQSKRVFERHCEDTHGTKRYTCTECNKEYKCMRYLRTHVNNVHGSHSQNYTCDHCQKSFWKKRPLRQHIDSVHGERIHRCLKCDKIFKCRSQLRQHKTRIHGKAQHKCEVCHKLFTTRYILWAHVKTAHGLDDCQSKSDSCSQYVHDSCSIARDTNAAVGTGAQQNGPGAVKSESADAELELGPVVFQHMDSHYQPLKDEPQLD